MLHVRSILHAHILPLAVYSRFFSSSHSVFPAKTTATKNMSSTSHSLVTLRCCQKREYQRTTARSDDDPRNSQQEKHLNFCNEFSHTQPLFLILSWLFEYPFILLIIRVNGWSKVATSSQPLL